MADRGEEKLETLIHRLRKAGLDEVLVGEVSALRAGYRQMRIMATQYRMENEHMVQGERASASSDQSAREKEEGPAGS